MKTIIILLICACISSCTVFKDKSAPENETDLVCGMKIIKSDAYTYKYEGKKYFFDSYNCKQAFIMNPKKFIENTSMDKKQ